MNDVNRLIGAPEQLLKARRIMFRDGRSEGIKAIELQNQNGLYITCIEDQCLNIYDFSYKGMNCAFQSKNGLVSNRYFNGGANEFSFYWPAGMLYTCGLTNVGPGTLENGIYHAEHGRIGMMPAENVAMEVTEEGAIITGKVKDILCGHYVELYRTIEFPACGKEIKIYDRVTNREAMPVEMMLMYHCNFGYPLLTPGSRIVKGAGEIYDNIGSATNVEECFRVTEARDDKVEEVYCHTNVPDEKGFGYAAVINDKKELGCYIKYQMDTLPFLIEWKNMCSHDYCVGLEPSNSYIMGRDKEREHGTLPILAPYETKDFQVYIGILDGMREIHEFESRL